MRPRLGQRGRLLAAIFAGGACGTLARAGVELLAPAGGHGWPWATFSVNLGGAALLGYAVTRLQERLPPATYAHPFLGTGLCGALTTFSTLQIEAIDLARNDHAARAVAYVLASVCCGLIVVRVTTALVRRTPLR